MHDNLNIIPGSQDETKKLTPGVNIWPPYECHGCAMHSQTHTHYKHVSPWNVN